MKLRINKLLSDAGIGSRRDVEQLIRDGRVIINGREAGLTDVVGADDEVLLDDMDLPVADLIREAEYEQSAQEDEETDNRLRSAKPGKKFPNGNGNQRGGERPARRFENDEWDRQFADHNAPQQHRKPAAKRTAKPEITHTNKGRTRNSGRHHDDD